MRNVTRDDKPPSLKRNAARWTRELLKQISKCQASGTRVPEKYYDRYHKDDVLAGLKGMYGGLCCYCEGRIGEVAFDNIEHRIPKRLKPKFTFDWDNLHLACPKCNTYKSDKYNDRSPPLDAVMDVPITDHLTYDLGYDGVWRMPLTDRGESTVADTQLNRARLIEGRREVFLAAMAVIIKVKDNPGDPSNGMRVEQLEAMSSGRYGSVIRYYKDRILQA